MFVDRDTSRLSDLDACLSGKLHVGPHPDCHDGELAGKLRPVAELDGGQLAVLAQEGCEAVPGYHVGVLAFHVVLDKLCHFPVKEGEELGQEFHHGDLHSGKLEGLACFDADQTPADDDGLLDRPLVAHLSEVIRVTHRCRVVIPKAPCRDRGSLGIELSRSRVCRIRSPVTSSDLRSLTVTVLAFRSMPSASVSVFAIMPWR